MIKNSFVKTSLVYFLCQYLVNCNLVSIPNYSKKKEDLPSTHQEHQKFFSSLKKVGLKTRIVFPSKASPEDFNKNYVPYKDAFNRLNVTWDKNALGKSEFPYLNYSNMAHNRLKDLKKAFEDKNHNIVYAERGGSGFSGISSSLHNTKLVMPEKTQKCFVGYSDITLGHHVLANKKLKEPDKFKNLRLIHGPVLFELFLTDKSNGSKKDLNNFIQLKRLLIENKRPSIKNLKPLNPPAKNAKSIAGPIWGGNTTLVTNTLGTPYSIIHVLNNSILFLEDIGEISYKFVRYMDHLKNAGIFEKVSAVIFCGYANSDQWIDTAIKDYANNLNIPCYRTDKIGHGRINTPIELTSTYKVTPMEENNNGDFQLSPI